MNLTLTIAALARSTGAPSGHLLFLCRQGLIPGAVRRCGAWRIPVHTVDALKRHPGRRPPTNLPFIVP